jgi:hypothetical protein
MTDEIKGREFDIAAPVAELLDTLKPEQQKQVMAMLASRYGLKLTEPPKAAGRGYGPAPKQTYLQHATINDFRSSL